MLTAAFHACRCGASLVRADDSEYWACPKAPRPLSEPPPSGLTKDGDTITMPAKEWRHAEGVCRELVQANLAPSTS